MRSFKRIILTIHVFALVAYASLGAPATVLSQISVDIRRPAENQLVGHTLFVSAKVQTEFEIRAVTAAVDDRKGDLTYNSAANAFEGTLSLEGRSLGQKTLVVTAEDVFNNTARDSVTFIYDPPPTIEVTEPPAESVARPGIRLRASCSDLGSDQCEIRVRVEDRRNDRTELLSGERELDLDLDLSKWDGQEVTLLIAAIDTAGQESQVSRPIFVESSPSLTEVETVDGRVVDADADRILFTIRNGDNWEQLFLFNRSEDTVRTFPWPEDLVITPNFIDWLYLTPNGAIFEAQEKAGSGAGRISEWYNDEFIDHGPNSTHTLKVAGTFAVWNPPYPERGIMLRNLRTQETMTINFPGFDPHIETDGTVTFWKAENYNIYRYRDGVITQITHDDSLLIWNVSPVAEGDRVLYQKSTPCCNNQTFAIALHDGAEEVLLREFSPFSASPGRDYQVMKGWIAFTRLGNLEQTHVWLKKPTGEEQQVSFFSASSVIETLHSDGTLTFTNDGRRYLANFKGEFEKISSDLGRSFVIGGLWHVAIGRTLFEVTTNIAHVEAEELVEVQTALILYPAYPNPFNSETTVRFVTQKRDRVKVELYNLRGRLIKQLYDGKPEAGKLYAVRVNSKGMASGIYFLRVSSLAITKTQKILLIK